MTGCESSFKTTSYGKRGGTPRPERGHPLSVDNRPTCNNLLQYHFPESTLTTVIASNFQSNEQREVGSQQVHY